MSDFIIISDFFVDEIQGGCELNNAELDKILHSKKLSVANIKASMVTMDFLRENKNSKFIIANFVSLAPNCAKYIENNLKYIIYEHDHKYLITRDPSKYKN